MGQSECLKLLQKKKKWMTTREVAKCLKQEHKDYGKVVSCMLIEGESYRFFDKEGSISMIPLSVLQLEEIK